MTRLKAFLFTFNIFLILISVITKASKTPAQLLNDLRSSQLDAMIKEQDERSKLKFPDEQATASYNEAKKRILQADSDIFEINATPYSPFKVEKSPNNLGYLGRGYDVLYGNPLDESGRVDPGFRSQAVELEYLQNRFTSDGEYRIPDNADVIMEPSALFSSSFNDVRTVNDYKQQLNEDVKKTAGFGFSAGFVSMSGEFSQSKSYKSNKESIKKGGKVNIDIIGRATAYKAWLHTLGDMNASIAMQYAIQDLPDKQCLASGDLPPYYRLIEKFGTHFTSVVTMGAKAVQRLTMTTKESMSLKQEGISTNQVVSATVGFMAKGVSATAKFGKEKSSSSDTKITDILKTMDIQKKDFYIGGEPPSLPYSQNYYFSVSLDGKQSDDPGIGSTESLREWGRSAFERPVPIQYQLQQIHELFDKSHLPSVKDTDTVIGKKKNCMKKALREYCSKITTDVGDCVSYDDGSTEPDAIRYGDLIAIQKVSNTNPSKYLNVPQDNPKFVPGNNAEYMKVVPVDSKAFWKYGNALHYEEPFNLISEYSSGHQRIISCGYGQNEHYVLFNDGTKDVTCDEKALPIGQWTRVKNKWCGIPKKDLLAGKKTVRKCEEDCVQNLGDRCVGIQFVDLTRTCAYCQKTNKVGPVKVGDLGSSPVYFFNRIDTGKTLQHKLTATLYFASPLDKKPGDIVKKDDQVYIGVTSYEARNSLFDVRRPAFLKVAQNEAVVHQDDGNVIQNLNSLRPCTNTPKNTHLDCSFWWKILASEKMLRTYPNVHFEKAVNQ